MEEGRFLSLQLTMVYVTHDQIEAMTLADRIVLLSDGVIVQQGKPLDLFERPINKFVASFLGSPQMNFVTARFDVDGDALALYFDQGRKLPLDKSRETAYRPWSGKDVILGIRPEYINRAGGPSDHRSESDAKIQVLIDLVEPTGTRTYVQFLLSGTKISAELRSQTVDLTNTKIELLVDMKRIILFDSETENVISG